MKEDTGALFGLVHVLRIPASMGTAAIPDVPPVKAEEIQIQLGQLRLSGRRLNAAEAADEASLTSLLTVGVPKSTPEAPRRLEVRRHRGRNVWFDCPAWIATYHPGRQTGVPIPSGPFLLPDASRAFLYIERLARWWTGDSSIGDLTASTTVARAIIPDERAWMHEAIVRHQALDVVIRGTAKDRLLIAQHGRDIHGRTVESLVTLDKTEDEVIASLELAAPMDEIELHLFGANGFVFDSFGEHRVLVREGESLFHGARGDHRVGAEALAEALQSGEDVRTEYKEWLPTTKDEAKSHELGRTAIAFANTQGGSIFVGVNDRGEVVGTDAQVFRFAKKAATSVAECQRLYVESIQDRLWKEVQPPLLASYNWIQSGSHSVLQIRIAKGGMTLHYLTSSGECFVRRGATNRIAPPEEVAQLLNSRRRGPGIAWTEAV